VTEVLRHLDKPALLHWATRLGLEGRTLQEELRDTGAQGTAVHASCAELLTASGATAARDPAVREFIRWREAHQTGDPVLIEQPLISEEHRIGGTPDVVLPVDGALTLVDLKAGRAVYREHLYQAGAYLRMVQLAGIPAERAMVLLIPRAGDPYQVYEVTDPETCWRITLLCRELHDLMSRSVGEEI